MSHELGSSLEAHEESMKVHKLEGWLFGERGSTPIPYPRPPKAKHEEHVSAESAALFKGTASDSTDSAPY